MRISHDSRPTLKMHNEEAPRRSIRGQASDEEFAELEEEGIGVFRLPLPKKEDLN